MKVSSGNLLAVVALTTSTALRVGAFSPTPTTGNSATTIASVERRAKNSNGWWTVPLATVALGWTLASPAFAFSVNVEQTTTSPPQQTTTTTTTTLLVADSMSLDFSMPSYDSKTVGFGEGTEAYLSDTGSKRKAGLDLTDPGSYEREKQAEAMRKAEAARKERVAAEMKARKQRETEQYQREKQRQAEKASRWSSIFD